MIKSKFNLIKFSAGIFCTLQLIGLLTIFAYPLPANAQTNSQATQTLKFTPQITIPNSDFEANTEMDVGKYNATTKKIASDLLPRYIMSIYNYGLVIIGILATFVLMGAGILWLVSGGDSGKITQAKELIGGSVAGIIILVCAWVILNTVNPELVNLKTINQEGISSMNKVYCCDLTNGEFTVDVKSVNGKLIHTDGSKKDTEFLGCEKLTGYSAQTCPEETTCSKYDKKYFCYNPKNVCCTCETPGEFICQENMVESDCKKKCETLRGSDDRMRSYYKTHIFPQSYSCAPIEERSYANYTGSSCQISAGGEW